MQRSLPRPFSDVMTRCCGPIEASEVNVEIGKHEFKSCEGTASNPDQDPRSRL